MLEMCRIQFSWALPVPYAGQLYVLHIQMWITQRTFITFGFDKYQLALTKYLQVFYPTMYLLPYRYFIMANKILYPTMYGM